MRIDDYDDEDDSEEMMQMSFEHTEINVNDETQGQEIIPEYHGILEKVRQKCREFRRSAVKNDDFLQKIMVEKYGKEISLKLDVKTRWNSTKEMVSRFLQVRS